MEAKIRRARNYSVFGIVITSVMLVAFAIITATGLFFDKNGGEVGETFALVFSIVYVLPGFAITSVLALVSFILSTIAGNRLVEGEYLQDKLLIAAIVFKALALVMGVATMVFGYALNVPQGVYISVYFVFLVISMLSICKQKGRTSELIHQQAKQAAAVEAEKEAALTEKEAE